MIGRCEIARSWQGTIGSRALFVTQVRKLRVVTRAYIPPHHVKTTVETSAVGVATNAPTPMVTGKLGFVVCPLKRGRSVSIGKLLLLFAVRGIFCEVFAVRTDPTAFRLDLCTFGTWFLSDMSTFCFADTVRIHNLSLAGFGAHDFAASEPVTAHCVARWVTVASARCASLPTQKLNCDRIFFNATYKIQEVTACRLFPWPTKCLITIRISFRTVLLS